VQGLEIHDFPGTGILVGGNLASYVARNNVIGTDSNGNGDIFERNVVRDNGRHGIEIQGPEATGNVVAGNYVGTNTGGDEAHPNSTGVSVSFRANDNLIGTNGDGEADALERNVISGNAVHGVGIGAGCEQNTVAGNYIGFAANGSDPLGNGASGVIVSNADSNIIGPGNVIGNNENVGIWLGTASWNQVIGNLIGTDVTQTKERSNGFNGVRIFGGTGTTSEHNWIGLKRIGWIGWIGLIPRTAPAGNVIAYNGWNGVYIDTHTEGAAAIDNPIQYNSIHSNEQLGIELVASSCPINACSDGVTPNDSGDTDGGENSGLNYPVVRGASSDGINTFVTALIDDGLPNTRFTIQFFSNEECDSSGHGEGKTYLGQTHTTTNGAGNASVFAILPVGSNIDELMTATVTERINFNQQPGGTSEFSACMSIAGATFNFNANAVRALLDEFSDANMLDESWSTILGRRLDRAVRLADKGNPNAARAQLGVFQIIVRILEWRGQVAPEVAQPLLESSNAAQQLLARQPRGRLTSAGGVRGSGNRS
jgi:hypothetical protein